MELAGRVKGILFQPKQEWETVSVESSSIADIYRGYVIILAAIGPVASIIGMSIIGVSLPFVGSFRIPITTSIASAVVQYLLTVAGVYVLAIVIDKLAPSFSGQQNMNQAFKLAAYSYTPGWLAGIFALIPVLAVLGIVGLYGLYLLYVGLPILMKSPKEKSMGYTVTIIIAAVIIFAVIGVVSRAFISYPTPGMPMPRI